MRVLDERQAELVRTVCELIVPGCERTGAEVYVDALLARMPDNDRGGIVAAFGALSEPATRGVEGLAEVELTPEFQLARALACEAFYSDFVAPGAAALSEVELTPEFQVARALACEAFYSDFVAPGAAGPGAWQEIDFNSPLATRLHKDWSYLGVAG